MPAYLDNLLDFADMNDTNPFAQLKSLAEKWNLEIYSEEFSQQLDKCNYWPHYRERFHYPKIKDLPNGMIKVYRISNSTKLFNSIFISVDLTLVDTRQHEECIYLCGNSLGLQLKTAKEYVNREFDKWAKMFENLYFILKI